MEPLLNKTYWIQRHWNNCEVWQKKIIILYEMHSNAHRQEDVLVWRFTYLILYSASHLVCPFPIRFAYMHSILGFYFFFTFVFYLLGRFIFLSISLLWLFNLAFVTLSFFSFFFYLIPLSLLLSHLHFLVFTLLCLFLFLVLSPAFCVPSYSFSFLPSLSVTPCPIDQHRTWVPHALCLSCGHFTLIQYCRELMV